MKLKLSVFIFLLAATLSPAQTNSLTALLQQGLLEEQANRNLDAAIADYQSLALQFDKDRQLAATAIFRLGECYRAQGKTNEAATQYQRILRDFSDQQTLATLSGQDLAGMGQSAAPNPPKAANQFTSEGTAEQIRELDIIKKLQPMPAYRICQLAPTLLTDATLNNLIDQFNRGEQAKSPASVLNAIGDQIHERLDVLSQTLALELSISGNPATGALTNTALTGSDTTDVNDRDQSNETPLILAALNGNQKIVSILLAHKADVNAKEDAGRTVLYLAVNGNHPQIIKQLLAAGAEPNMEDVSGRTPLSIAAEYNSSEAVKILLDAKADPNVGKLDAALLSAIHAKNAASAELLLTAGANPNVIGEVDWPSYRQDFHSVAPLWLAVKMSQFPMVQLLLKFKADPNDTRTDGQSLLFSALTDTNILEALLEAGAPVDSMSVDTPSWSPHWTPLEDAVENNNAPAVALLLKHGANPNGHGSATCLQRAVFHMDDPLIFDQLLTHKADPNIRNQDGKTPLEVIKERATGNSLSWDQKRPRQPDRRFASPTWRAGQPAALERHHRGAPGVEFSVPGIS